MHYAAACPDMLPSLKMQRLAEPINTAVLAMRYEIEELPEHGGSYTVVAVNESAHGEKLITLFSGPDAKRRAEEYAKWKNNEQEITGEQLLAR